MERSHTKNGWETFTDVVLRRILDSGTTRDVSGSADGAGSGETGETGVVIMAWGFKAQKTCERLKIDEVGIVISIHGIHGILRRNEC